MQYFSSEELNKILEKCFNETDIRYFLTNSTCYDDFEKTINLSYITIPEKILMLKPELNTPDKCRIFPGIGHHPWYLENLPENWYENFENFIKENLEDKKKKYFIGEIGIDGGRPKKYNLNRYI